MITSVDPGSVADDSGLEQGMVIQRFIAGSQKIDIRNMDDFRRAEKLMMPGLDCALMVQRMDPRTRTYGNAFVSIHIP
jgi:hypothetical protein